MMPVKKGETAKGRKGERAKQRKGENADIANMTSTRSHTNAYVTDARHQHEMSLPFRHVAVSPFRLSVGHQHTTSFGEPLAIKGAVDTDRARTGFIGRETDAEHNLGAFGARLYSSEYGRFMAVDPLWEEFEWITPYAYAENSPLRLKDPSGEVPIDTFWDGLNVVVDFGRVVYHTFTGNTSKAKDAAKDLAADGLALAIPYVPAGLTKLRHVDDAVDAVKTADKVVDASKAGKKTTEGAEQVGKGSASREPKSLPDQMALEQAKKGGKEAGRKDLPLKLNDPRYQGMNKFSYVLKPKYGKQIEIHYVENPKTGERMDFKFKQHYGSTSKPKE